MVTINDLSTGQSLPDSIIVTVTDVDWNAGKSRRAEVRLKDSEGTPLYLIDYDGANLSVNWTPDFRYQISQCDVHKGRDDFQVCLAPSKRTEVEEMGAVEGTFRVLVVGDTHIGRQWHPGDGQKINPIESFSKAVEHGIERDVEAVVHVGDIFHESADSRDKIAVATRVMDPLDEAGIPFYYVKGNHESESGNELLDSSNNYSLTNLSTSGSLIAPNVTVYGINHSEMGDIPSKELDFPQSMEGVSILVLHQTITQLSGEGPESVDLQRIENHASAGFDFVISGHHHDADRELWNGIPIMYSGATARLSKNPDSIDQVAWILEIGDSSVAYERYDLK